MYVNERDQINYHGFLRALREMNQVSQECVSKGICTVSGMNRFENGNRVAEKLMRDRLTARLGISGEKYEDYLQPKEYVRWEQRLRIVNAIEQKKWQNANEELDSYAQLSGLNCVNKQFIEAMRFMILLYEGASKEILRECITKAVKQTVPNVEKALSGVHLLSDQEINLIAEEMRLCLPPEVIRDERLWRISEYEKLISYMEDSHWEKLQQAKVYPKVVYYICQLLLEGDYSKVEYERGLELCHNAIELLRDSSRLYYFIELTEIRSALANRFMNFDIDVSEKSKLEEMLNENNAWEKVLKELYEEYKVAPYMSDFCYLYYETECHDMVKVIETRRKMLGLSRVKLGDGICTDRTIIRFEREGRNPSIDLVRLLFEKMGLCAEYRRARVVTNDVEVLMLSIDEAKYMNNYDFAIGAMYLDELKSKLNMNIPHNKQEISRLNVVIKNRINRLSNEELYDLSRESLEYTLPISALDVDVTKYFTRNEIKCLFDLAIKIKGDLPEKCLEILCNKYGNVEEKSYLEEICAYEFVTGGLVSKLGDMGRYEESTKISHKVVKECLSHRRLGQIMSILYNIVWNYQNNIANEIQDDNYIKEILYKSLIISMISKNNYRVAFFQDKLREYQ